jgi:hypothetical protein
MECVGLLDELKVLTAATDVFVVSREVNELKQRFNDAFLEMERKEYIAQLEATEKGEEYEGLDLRSIRKAFNEQYLSFKDRLKVQTDLRNALEKEHLQQKKVLIEQLRKTIQEEENIGTALAQFKEIQDSWKTIGDIPRNKREEIQKEYSRLIEQFFYNLKIYRELKDHDLKRNLQLKEQVIKRLKELQVNPSIKESEQNLKALQNEWEDIGPVVNEEWERLKSEYWSLVRSVYERIHAYYDERRNNLEENLKKKKELLQQTEQLLSTTADLNSAKSWDQVTAQLLKIQEQWRGIGFGPKKENEELYKQFRTTCDRFFLAKKTFFASLEDVFKEIAEKKKKFIEKAESIKDSTDWKETTETLIRLQKEWKKMGSAGQKLEQRLWTSFRNACDHFFTAKNNHQVLQEKVFEDNLRVKRALIEEIESYNPTGNKAEDLSALKGFSARFSGLGPVPAKDKEALFRHCKTALDKQYASIKLDSLEKERILFESRMEILAASSDPGKAYAREKTEIRQQIEKLRSEMLLLENNLGFFARSKGADALRKEVEGKIRVAGDRIESLKRRLKLIPNE